MWHFRSSRQILFWCECSSMLLYCRVKTTDRIAFVLWRAFNNFSLNFIRKVEVEYDKSPIFRRLFTSKYTNMIRRNTCRLSVNLNTRHVEALLASKSNEWFFWNLTCQNLNYFSNEWFIYACASSVAKIPKPVWDIFYLSCMSDRIRSKYEKYAFVVPTSLLQWE